MDSPDSRDGHSLGHRGIKERAIAGDDDEIRVASSIRGGEVDRVVTAQPVRLGEVTGAAGERVVDVKAKLAYDEALALGTAQVEVM